MRLRRLFQTCALAGAAALAQSALAAYTVELQSTNDCRHDGSLVVTLVLTGVDPSPVASGGQFFLTFDNGLAVASIAPGAGLINVGNSFNNGAHTAVVAVGVDFLMNPGGSLSAGQTLATITFNAPGAYCAQAGLVAFQPSHNPPTRLTDNNGVSIAVGTTALGAVYLNDTTPPVINGGNALADVPHNNDTDSCSWSGTVGAPGFTDNCTSATLSATIGGDSYDWTSNHTFPVGTTVIVWKATDHCGNMSTSNQNVVVTDTQAPVISCAHDITVNADAGGCTAIVNNLYGTGWSIGGDASVVLRPGTNDAVGEMPSVASSPNQYSSLDYTPPGPFPFSTLTTLSLDYAMVQGCFYGGAPRVYIGIDTTGDGVADHYIHVYLGTYPAFADCPPLGVWSNTGNLCAALDQRWDTSQFAGGTFYDTYAHAQTLLGAYNVVSAGFVMDASWHADQNIRIDNFTVNSAVQTFSAAGATDNCGVASISGVRSDSQPLSAPFPSGTTAITWTVTDIHGNSSSCVQNVTVTSSNTLVATAEETGLSSPAVRCVTFDLWNGCTQGPSVSGNIAFNSTNTINFESYANGPVPGAGGPDNRTPGDLGTWWLPSNCATSASVSPIAAHTGSKGLIVGNNGSGNDGVINNLESPRLPYVAGETASPVNAASSVFRSSYWFRTASAVPADGFSFKSETYGPDRTTYFGTFYQTAFGDTSLNSGAYAIEDLGGGNFDFVFHPVATNLNWGAWYRVETTITFVNGANNDTVDYRMYDSSNALVGSALGLHDWEEGTRQFGYDPQIFGVDAIQFQARGDTSAPGAHDVAYVDDITYSALPTVLMDVPCNSPAYTAATARDIKHSLRRTSAGAPNFGINGTDYYATFTAAAGGKALEQGNLNDDQYVDILDAGIFLGKFNTSPGGSSPCGFLGAHADFSGNGIVFTEDFTFIQLAFLHFRDLDPCGGSLVGQGPVTDITVDEAMARGLPDVAKMDMNLDGRVNAQDIAWIAVNGLPRCIADFNDDQSTDVQDIFAFLNAWFMNHPRCDINNNSRVEVQDIFEFLNSWFQGGCN
jgi:hypothetical protein